MLDYNRWKLQGRRVVRKDRRFEQRGRNANAKAVKDAKRHIRETVQ